MSHELRTPLNSILILGQQLADNPDGNLTPRQVEFARTIHGAGTDLLNLISDILDLSKIKSGTVSVDAEEIRCPNLQETVTRPFRHEAESRGLSFDVQRRSDAARHHDRQQAPAAGAEEPAVRTRSSSPSMAACSSPSPRSPAAGPRGHPMLDHAPTVVAFEVSDTGIGIRRRSSASSSRRSSRPMHRTSRKYGGTGLGLAISRELSNLLGGEIQLRSKPGVGSTFTLYLPLAYMGPAAARPRDQRRRRRRAADVALPSPVRLARAADGDRGRRPPRHHSRAIPCC